MEELNDLFFKLSYASHVILKNELDFYKCINNTLKYGLFAKLKKFIEQFPFDAYFYFKKLSPEYFSTIKKENPDLNLKFLKAYASSLEKYQTMVVKEILKHNYNFKIIYENSLDLSQVLKKHYNELEGNFYNFIEDFRNAIQNDCFQEEKLKKYWNLVFGYPIIKVFDDYVFKNRFKPTIETDEFFYNEFIKRTYGEDYEKFPCIVILPNSFYKTYDSYAIYEKVRINDIKSLDTNQTIYKKVYDYIITRHPFVEKLLKGEGEIKELENYNKRLNSLDIDNDLDNKFANEYIFSLKEVIISGIKLLNLLQIEIFRKSNNENAKFQKINNFILNKCKYFFNSYNQTLKNLLEIFSYEKRSSFEGIALIGQEINKQISLFINILSQAEINFDTKLLIYNYIKTDLSNDQINKLKSSDNAVLVDFLFKRNCKIISNINLLDYYKKEILFADEFKQTRDFILTLKNPMLLGTIVSWAEENKDNLKPKDKQKVENFVGEIKNLLNEEGLILAENKGRKEAEEKLKFNFDVYYEKFKTKLLSQKNAKNLDFDLIELFESVTNEYYNKGSDIRCSFASGEFFYNVIKNVVGLKETSGLDLSACYINVLKGIEQFLCAVINYACKLNKISFEEVKKFYKDIDENFVDYSSLNWAKTLKSYKDIVEFLGKFGLIKSDKNSDEIKWGKTRNPLAHKQNIYEFNGDVFDVSYKLLIQILKEIHRWA